MCSSDLGRYKIFPVVGSAVMALGLFLLSLIDATSSYWTMAAGMLVLGIGIGLCMQVLTIIVQNIVDYRDLGVATSGVTFFRTLGSSFGAAIFGTIYANVLGNSLAAAFLRAHVDPRTVSTPKELHAKPAEQIAPIVEAYAHAIHVVFLAAVPVALAAFVLSLFLKQVPLRGTAQAGASSVGDGFGMPEGSDSLQQLQTAIARVIRQKGREAFATIHETSGTTLDVADGWCVAQVHVRDRVGAPTSLVSIARQVRVPSPVLRPAFTIAREHGYLTGAEGDLQLTTTGEQEIDKFAVAIRAWLATELSDWGAGDDALLTTALTNLSRQFVDRDPELLPSPPRELTST